MYFINKNMYFVNKNIFNEYILDMIVQRCVKMITSRF